MVTDLVLSATPTMKSPRTIHPRAFTLHPRFVASRVGISGHPESPTGVREGETVIEGVARREKMEIGCAKERGRNHA